MSLIAVPFGSISTRTPRNNFDFSLLKDIINSSNIFVGEYSMPTSSKVKYIPEITDQQSETLLDLQIKKAAELLYNDYLNDEELTAFHVLDGEDFYVEG